MATNRFEMAAPKWNGGKRCVGLNADRLNCDMVEVDIRYKDKLGVRVFPKVLNMSSTKVKTYPIQVVSGGVRLHIVPIADLTEKSVKSQVITKPAKGCNACGGQEFYTRLASQWGEEEELCCRCHPKQKEKSNE